MTEKSGVQRQRMNIIDYILILIAFSIAVFLAFHIKNYTIEPSGGTESKSVTVGIRVSPLRDELKGNVSTGDTVYIGNTGDVFGEVKNLSDSVYTYEGIDSQTGKTVLTSVDGYFVLNLTVTADAVSGEDGYTVGGTLLTVGGEISVRTKNFSGTGIVVSVTENGEGE